MKKVIKFIIFATVILFIGSIIWKRISHKSTDEIFQEKAEHFYENQESFEAIVEYVRGFDFRSIIESNKMWSDVKIDGITFRLEKLGMEDNYGLCLYSTKELLLQLLNTDKKTSVVHVIGENSDMTICYEKKKEDIITIIFSIEDKRLENVMARLVWHNSDYEPMADWVYPLNENWTIIALGRDKVK